MVRILLPLSLMLTACVEELPAPADDDTGVTPLEAPDLPVAHCDMAPYELVEEPLGDVVSWEPHRSLSLDAIGLDFALTAGGLEKLTPTPYDVDAYRFRYTTQDRGQIVEATGILAVPSLPPDTEARLMLQVHSFAGLLGPCSPSQGRLEEAIEPILLASRGFVVVAPDLIGLDGSASPDAPHAPLVGEQVAIGSWDALRAGRALLTSDLGQQHRLTVGDDIVLWGASQGGHGVLWTELIGPYYAPEMSVAAVVAGVPPLDVLPAMKVATSSWNDASGLGALITLGMARWYGVADDLSDLFAPELAATLETALGQPADDCEGGVDFSADAVEEVFADAFVAAAQSGDWDAVGPIGCALAEAGLPTTSTERKRTTPILTIFGENDEVVVPEAQEAGWDALCEDGWDLTWMSCADADHAFANLWSMPEQLSWIDARLRGEPTEGGCERPAPVVCAATPDELAE